MTVVTNEQVLERLDLGELIETVEVLFREIADGSAVQPPRHAAEVKGSPSLVVPMFAVSAAKRLACFKMLVDNPDNVPRQRSTILAVDSETGVLRGVFEGGAITQLRTAATSAVATRALSRPDSEVLGLIGAGAQARTHLRALAAVRDFRHVVVWNRTPERIAELDALAQELGVSCLAVDSPREVVEQADVVCTLTPARDPIVEGAWLRPGQHINVVGAPPRPEYREIESAAFARARVVLDAIDVALAESGAVRAAIAQGVVQVSDLQLDLGSVLRDGFERSAHDITLFTSVGLPIQDLAAISLLLDRS